MCETPSATPGEGLTDLRPDVVEAGDRRLEVTGLGAFLEVARRVAAEPEVRRTAAGFIGYGATREGDRVLIAVDTEHHPLIVEAVARALREKGARVDVITVDAGPDREFDELDEVRVIMRREPWARNPRRWEGIPWVEELALKNGYDLLVHGKGGGIPDVPHRYEAIPWLQPEQFLSPATTFPRDLHSLINRKVWPPSGSWAGADASTSPTPRAPSSPTPSGRSTSTGPGGGTASSPGGVTSWATPRPRSCPRRTPRAWWRAPPTTSRGPSLRCG